MEKNECPKGFKSMRISAIISSASSNVEKIRRNPSGEPLVTKSTRTESAKRRIGALGLLDRKAAALHIGISERSIQRHKDNGDLPFYKLGGLIGYLPADLDAFPVRFESRGRKKRGSS